MTIDERNKVLLLISEIEKFNFSEEVAKHFKGSTEIDSVAIGRYPVKDFINFFDRAINQLKTELESENYFFYPNQANAQPIAGIQIEGILNHIKISIEQNQIPNIP